MVESPFVASVIHALETDDFLRSYRESYFDAGSMFDKYANNRSCAVDDGWHVHYGLHCVGLWYSVKLERGHNTVRLTRGERKALTRAVKGAMARLRRDRAAYLESLRQ